MQLSELLLSAGRLSDAGLQPSFFADRDGGGEWEEDLLMLDLGAF